MVYISPMAADHIAPETIVRAAIPERDAQGCAALYAPYVRDTAISFEYDAPSADQMAERISVAHVWLVAVEGEGIVGYAYGSRHAERAAYLWSADVAVYVDSRRHRRGIGRMLYEQLIPRLRDEGLWTLCAGITQPNAASDGLHRELGFREVGIYRRIGFKAGEWHDVRWWQLDLRPGEAGNPQSRLARAERPVGL
jgi:phosphinothricin acetyltransferase